MTHGSNHSMNFESGEGEATDQIQVFGDLGNPIKNKKAKKLKDLKQAQMVSNYSTIFNFTT